MVILQHWLLRFGSARMGLRHIVGEFGDWMANDRPPWAAYRALMPGRLIGLTSALVYGQSEWGIPGV